MDSSRRDFLRCCLAGGSAPAAAAGFCHSGSTDTTMKPVAPGRMKLEPSYIKAEKEGKLGKIETELWDILRSCRLCPRACGANRLKGEKGVCSSTARLKIYSAGPHFGEEKPLVGKGGSGTIFFSNCNLLCCFCQNWQINHRGDGEFRTHEELAEMMLRLQRQGCHNINLVTPTHVVPHIVKALRIALAAGLNVPLVYNTGGYDNLEIVKMLDGIVDIYLPDFKYQEGRLASRYSSGASDYPEVAAGAIKEMHRQVGELRLDDRGIAERGLIIRHLVMPGNIAGTYRFVQWVARELTRDTYVNIMAQYHPAHRALDYPEISRRISAQEWRQALKWAEEAGLRRLDGAT